ncbi:protein FAR1-RELATED SEQUENCE 5-like [Juglans microcarpa x Juglans regia]|uniref:protein FAR1-RELATED SEQUENCE 5-like n=1 Tax=Juglans microcarpa x Juglans regia TaxID=2249226 RepID=UPI001B7EAF3F|nr:protein FAR1-RELATED SEQUENCE 5-like [Juglans microcarpa x Juglans regia]
MSTTQRNESMNAFFDGYIHAKTNLKEFVNQFDNALKKKIENKNCTNFHSFNVTIPYISRSPIKKRYQDLYTNAKFREVQHQLIGIIDLNPVLLKANVDFSDEDAVAKCSCGLFEMRGIVCWQIFAVFKWNEIKTMPDMYILDRWRKDIKRRYTLIHNSYDAEDRREDANRYSRIMEIDAIILGVTSRFEFDCISEVLYNWELEAVLRIPISRSENMGNTHARASLELEMLCSKVARVDLRANLSDLCSPSLARSENMENTHSRA